MGDRFINTRFFAKVIPSASDLRVDRPKCVANETSRKEVDVSNFFHAKLGLLPATLAVLLLAYAGQLSAHEPREMSRMQQTIDILTKQLADANTKIRRLEASVSSRGRRSAGATTEGCDVGDARANVQLAKGNFDKGETLESWIRDYGKSCSPQELTQLKLLANELFYSQASLDLIELLR